MSNSDEPLSQDALDALLAEIAQGDTAEAAGPADEVAAAGTATAAPEVQAEASAPGDEAVIAEAAATAQEPAEQSAPLNLVSFEDELGADYGSIEGFDRVQDIPLEITVELGRTRLLIRDILELGIGSIVELEKMAGEPVDLLANGLLIARGEVVVIEDNFGVRITEIITAVERNEAAKGEQRAHA